MSNKEKIYTKLETIAKIIYLIHLLLAFNALINRTFILDITMALSVMWACVVLLLRIRYVKDFIRRKDFLLLVFFIISFMLTSIFNIEYGLIKNIKCLAWMIIQIGILFFNRPQRNVEHIKTEFELLSKIFIALSTLTNAVSLFMFFMRYQRLVEINGKYCMLGFYWNRLFGIYDEPNQGALFAVITIFMIIYLASRKRKIWHGIVIFIQISFILLSDSRTGALSLGIALGIYLAIKGLRCKKITNIVLAVMAAGAVAGLTYEIRQPLQQFYVNSTNGVYEYFERKQDKEHIEEPDEEPEITIKREELTQDPSNRRFDIWKSGIELFLRNPILGYGRNYVNYALEEIPETYIVNNDMGDFDSMHNIVVEILVQQGILGMIIFVIFLIYCIAILVRKHKCIKTENQEFASICFSIICAIVAASMLMPTVIYLNSPESYMMWLCLGYLMVVVEKDTNIIISNEAGCKNENTKILIGYVISKESSGINKYLDNVMKALRGSDVEIHMLTSDYSLELQRRMDVEGVNLITIDRLVHPIKRYRQIKQIVKSQNYDIAYFNISEAMNCICNIAVKRNSNAIVITHSHSAGSDEECGYKRTVYQIINAIARRIVVRNTDYFYACSQKAGEWVFGKKISRSKLRVIRNTIDTKKFVFDLQERRHIREQFKLEDDVTVYGFVGNLVYQKNPFFLIRVFEKIWQNDKKSKLLIVGDGILRDEMKRLAVDLEIDKDIVFAGAVSNVEAYMSAMDVFILPSNFEGLGIVGIEAQVNGLECYFSDGVPNEVVISDYAHFIELDKSEEEWAEEILKGKKKIRSDVAVKENILIDSEEQISEFGNIFLKKMY